MRHNKSTKILDRATDSRRALVRGLVTNVVLYDTVRTTPARARVVRSAVERLITLAKKNDLNTRRRLAAYLYTPSAVRKMVEVLGPRYQNRAGGYTRLVKLGTRKGDGAEQVQIEFVS